MTENEKNIYSKETDYDYAPTKIIKTTKKKKICLIQCATYIKNTFNKLIIRWEIMQSKFSLLNLFLLFVIPLSLFLYFGLYLFYYCSIDNIFIFNCYKVLKHEYVNDLVISLDDISVELGIKDIKSQFDGLSDMLFFQIYFKELISMGLLSEEKSVKIFPDISHKSEDDYASFDELLNESKANCYFKISKEEAEEYIDNRDDNLSELGKIYYNMLPLINYGSFMMHTYINQTFFIVYEFDNINKSIKGDELYFSFPKYKSEIEKSNNFKPTNVFLHYI